MITFKIFYIIFTVILILVLYFFVERSKKGIIPNIRSIPGMDAIEEAISRCVEMGRPVHYSPGTGAFVGWTAQGALTLAGLTILSHVARRTAKLGARLIVSCLYPDVYVVAEEIVRGEYLAEGCPDDFKTDTIRFFPMALGHCPYVSGVLGIFEREKPAANIMCGAFYFEAIILAEAGHSEETIQIAGSNAVTFFITTCDYVMIGEELFAASAKISQDPVQIGSITGQDVLKIGVCVLTTIGILLISMGNDLVIKLLSI